MGQVLSRRGTKTKPDNNRGKGEEARITSSLILFNSLARKDSRSIVSVKKVPNFRVDFANSTTRIKSVIPLKEVDETGKDLPGGKKITVTRDSFVRKAIANAVFRGSEKFHLQHLKEIEKDELHTALRYTSYDVFQYLKSCYEKNLDIVPQAVEGEGVLGLFDISGFSKAAGVIDNCLNEASREMERFPRGSISRFDDGRNPRPIPIRANLSNVSKDKISFQNKSADLSFKMKGAPISSSSRRLSVITPGVGEGHLRIAGNVLHQYLNKMLDTMVQEIQGAGIDIVKFAGDALQCVTNLEEGDTLGDAVIRNVLVALRLLELVTQNKSMGFKFGVHCAIGCGQILSCRVGGIKDIRQLSRWEHFVVGSAIDQTGRALHVAQVGEVVLSPEALSHMRLSSYLREDTTDFQCEELESGGARVRIDGLKIPTFPLKRPLPTKKELSNMIDKDMHVNFAQLLKAYCPAPLQNAIASGAKNAIGTCRLLTTIFIMLPSIGVFCKGDSPESYIKRAQQAFSVIQMSSSFFEGTVRQLIVDDKGAVAIIVFGLPPFSTIDIAGRAVETALTIRASIPNAKIGITTGSIYSGVIGSVERGEYAVVGDRVNMSARLMCKGKEGQILTDFNTKEKCDDRFIFKGCEPVMLKGKTRPVQVYEASGKKRGKRNSSSDRGFNEIVGRDNDIAELGANLEAEHSSKTVVVSGFRGVGKTCLINKYVDLVESHLKNETTMEVTNDLAIVDLTGESFSNLLKFPFIGIFVQVELSGKKYHPFSVFLSNLLIATSSLEVSPDCLQSLNADASPTDVRASVGNNLRNSLKSAGSGTGPNLSRPPSLRRVNSMSSVKSLQLAQGTVGPLSNIQAQVRNFGSVNDKRGSTALLVPNPKTSGVDDLRKQSMVRLASKQKLIRGDSANNMEPSEQYKDFARRLSIASQQDCDETASGTFEVMTTRRNSYIRTNVDLSRKSVASALGTDDEKASISDESQPVSLPGFLGSSRGSTDILEERDYRTENHPLLSFLCEKGIISRQERQVLLSFLPDSQLNRDQFIPDSTTKDRLQDSATDSNVEIFLRILYILLDILSQKCHICIVFDDAHNFSASSFALWEKMESRYRSVDKVHMVLGYRPGRKTAEGMQQRLNNDRFLCIKLDPLPRLALSSLVCKVLNTSSVSPEVLTCIWEKSKGNPQDAKSTIDKLLQQGYIDVDNQNSCVVATTVNLYFVELDTNDTLCSEILSTYDALIPAEQLVLQVLAIVGVDSHFDSIIFPLYQIAFIQTFGGVEFPSRSYLLDTVSAIAKTELIEVSTTNNGSIYSCRFSSSTIREIVYRSMPIRTRENLHKNRIEALLSKVSGDKSMTKSQQITAYFDIAEHCRMANKPIAAAEFYEKTAELCYSTGSYEDCMSMLQRCATISDELSSGSSFDAEQYEAAEKVLSLRAPLLHLFMGETCIQLHAFDDAKKALKVAETKLEKIHAEFSKHESKAELKEANNPNTMKVKNCRVLLQWIAKLLTTIDELESNIESKIKQIKMQSNSLKYKVAFKEITRGTETVEEYTGLYNIHSPDQDPDQLIDSESVSRSSVTSLSRFPRSTSTRSSTREMTKQSFSRFPSET
eukprot:g4135.t1